MRVGTWQQLSTSPPLLDQEDEEGHSVEGEVYRVCCSMLARLDELEDHPRYYRRREELVTMMHDGQGRGNFLPLG